MKQENCKTRTTLPWTGGWLVFALASLLFGGEQSGLLPLSPPTAQDLPSAAGIVTMERFIVEATRSDPRQWTYLEAPGFEILSRVGSAMTIQAARSFFNEIELERQFVPAAYWSPPATPSTYIIFDNEPLSLETSRLRPDPSRISDTEKITLDGGLYVFDQDTHCAVQNMWGLEWLEGVDYAGAHSGGGATGSAFLIGRALPAPPLWYQCGVVGLISAPHSRGETSLRLLPYAMTWARAQWITRMQTDRMVSEALKTKSLPVLPPIKTLFEPVDSAHSQPPPKWLAEAGEEKSIPSDDWLAESILFVRWGVFDKEPGIDEEVKDGIGHSRAFAAFLSRSCHERVTEGLFRECFGFGYEEMQRKLSRYLVDQSVGPITVGYPKISMWPPPHPPFSTRTPTNSEIARIIGDWERIEAASKKNTDPDLSRLYLKQAGKTLQQGFEGGARDPALLAALGLYDFDIGSRDNARAMLTIATEAAVPRPLAYIELAQIAYEDADRHPAGAGKKFSPQQTAAVLKPIFQCRRISQLDASAYRLVALAWKRSDTKPTPAQLAILKTVPSLFPFDSELNALVKEVFAQWGYGTESAGNIFFGPIRRSAN